jgi:hypothetical protein
MLDKPQEGNEERSVSTMDAMLEVGAITQDRGRTTGLIRSEEEYLVNILIDSSLYLEMSLAERKRLIRYLMTISS